MDILPLNHRIYNFMVSGGDVEISAWSTVLHSCGDHQYRGQKCVLCHAHLWFSQAVSAFRSTGFIFGSQQWCLPSLAILANCHFSSYVPHHSSLLNACWRKGRAQNTSEQLKCCLLNDERDLLKEDNGLSASSFTFACLHETQKMIKDERTSTTLVDAKLVSRS